MVVDAKEKTRDRPASPIYELATWHYSPLPVCAWISGVIKHSKHVPTRLGFAQRLPALWFRFKASAKPCPFLALQAWSGPCIMLVSNVFSTSHRRRCGAQDR